MVEATTRESTSGQADFGEELMNLVQFILGCVELFEVLFEILGGYPS